MNTPNNKRKKESRLKMENAFVKLIQTREIDAVTVTEICKEAGVNRTTFYASYTDIYDLAEAVQKRLEQEVLGLYQNEREHPQHDFLKLFYHIRDNQLFYKTYFKLCKDGHLHLFGYDTNDAAKYYNNKNIEYHIEFFGNGLNAVIKKWLNGGCRETPEEINEVIISEYRRTFPQ